MKQNDNAVYCDYDIYKNVRNIVTDIDSADWGL